MATIVKALPSVAFPWELDTLTFQRSYDGAEEMQATITYAGDIVFEESLFFDMDGTIVLDQLASLLMDYDTRKVETFTITVKEEGTTETYSCNVIPNNTSTEAAEDIVNSSFLTLLSGPKHCAPDAVEVVSFYTATGEEGLEVHYTYITDEGELQEVSLSRPLTVGAGEMASCGVNFAEYGRGGTLAKVTIQVGQRTQDYIINPSLTHSLRFINSFGQEDVIYFTEVEREAKPVRSSAKIGDVHRTYLVSPDTKITGSTLPLLESELVWAEDAANAIYLKDPEGRTVSVTDSEFRYSSSPTDLPQLKLTWKLAQQRYRFQRSTRTFDITFDTTYF